MTPWHPLWITFAATLAASLLLTPVARRLAILFGAVDAPDGRRKLQKTPVPLWGGVAVYAALLIGLMVARQTAPDLGPALSQFSLALAAAAGLVCVFGCIDDARDLKPRFKLLLQIASVLPIVMSGYYVDRVVAFGWPLELGWLGIPLTVCWLVGCINALNLLDGMDGLASVVGLSTAGMMAILATNSGHPHVALIAIVLAGALCGFLVYNLPPASIYLGDSGSMLIGLSIGMLSIQAALKTSATLSLTVPVVALAIPMFDTVLAVVRRRLSGRPVDVGDRGHIHHQLLDRGLTNWQALCIIGALCLTTGAAATAATILRNDALAWIITVAVLLSLVYTRSFGHHELAMLKLSVAGLLAAVLNSLVSPARASVRLRRAAERADFEQAWKTLHEEIALWHGRRLELRAELTDGSAAVRTWVATSNKPSQPVTWTLGCELDSPSGNRCRLLLTGADERRAEPWYLLRLAKLLKAFAQHWIDRPELIAPLTSPAASPATVPLVAPQQPRKHAA
ncbi:MAG: undecaprenyl/decaprenyl-phosphate alpha-N-acetylglucosaminyl 1-phosphate transferase [Pirellulales bacterium]|nr:undecaprenyl/decaprenyl-phosphate alpha-N-acetylglucosaminyl 1-phosphate transferase [Pirellulales bacterium]